MLWFPFKFLCLNLNPQKGRHTKAEVWEEDLVMNGNFNKTLQIASSPEQQKRKKRSHDLETDLLKPDLRLLTSHPALTLVRMGVIQFDAPAKEKKINSQVINFQRQYLVVTSQEDYSNQEKMRQ